MSRINDLPVQDCVKLLAACGDAKDALALMTQFHGSHKSGSCGLTFLDCFLNFLHLHLAEALDFEEHFPGCAVNGLMIVSCVNLCFVGVNILPQCRSHLLSTW